MATGHRGSAFGLCTVVSGLAPVAYAGGEYIDAWF